MPVSFNLIILSTCFLSTKVKKKEMTIKEFKSKILRTKNVCYLCSLINYSLLSILSSFVFF